MLKPMGSDLYGDGTRPKQLTAEVLSVSLEYRALFLAFEFRMTQILLALAQAQSAAAGVPTDDLNARCARGTQRLRCIVTAYV